MGSLRPRNSTRARKVRSAKSLPRPRRKPQAAPPSAGRKRSSASLPDLDSVLDAFSEALDLIQAAHMAQKQTDHWGPPEVAMSRAIAKLDRVYDDFDRAAIDLARFCRKQTKTGRRRL